MTNQLYLDHAASAPLLPAARDALCEGYGRWANPSSPHAQGRAVRAALEDARSRIADVLGWKGEIVLTSGASEALGIAIGRARVPLAAVSAVEHEAVLRLAGDAPRLPVDNGGCANPADAALPGLVAVQHVNNETGVIQPLAAIGVAVRGAGGLLLADCAQSAGKIALPDADMCVIAAHKFGGPVGVGALLLREWAMIEPVGGQERGYRPGTEAMPLILAMAAALEAGNGWLDEAARLRALLEAEITASGGEVVAADSARIPTIGACRMPGVAATVQLIRFDAQGIAVSAGSACSSGSLKTSHVHAAMGLDAKIASELLRISIGRETTEADIRRFVDVWRTIAAGARAAA